MHEGGDTKDFGERLWRMRAPRVYAVTGLKERRVKESEVLRNE